MVTMATMNLYRSPTDEMSDVITDIDATKFIGEQYNDCEFAFDGKMFKQHQQQDAEMHKQIEKELKQHPNSTKYTIKEVGGL